MISSFLLFCEIIEDLKKTTPKAWFLYNDKIYQSKCKKVPIPKTSIKVFVHVPLLTKR